MYYGKPLRIVRKGSDEVRFGFRKTILARLGTSENVCDHCLMEDNGRGNRDEEGFWKCKLNY